MNRGDVLDLGNLGKAAGKAAAEGDIDKVIQLLDKVDKILGNPLVQQILGIKQQPPYQSAAVEPAVQIVEKVPDGVIVPKSQVHAKLFSMANQMDEQQLMALLSQYGGGDVAEKVKENP
jgi:hypothetical protein